MSEGRARILVVEDEPLTQDVICEYLADDGYTLVTSTTGKKAWDVLQETPLAVDVVLLDRRLPDVDGLEILARIKQHPELRSVPVILETAATRPQDVVEGLEARAYYYLTKPFDETLLRPIVRTAVSDRMRYLELQRQLRQSVQVLGLMQHGSFRFQTLREASNLAVFLANTCPQPDRVVSGLSELLVNAVEYGNLGITYEEKSALVADDTWAAEVERRLQLSSGAVAGSSVDKVGSSLLETVP